MLYTESVCNTQLLVTNEMLKAILFCLSIPIGTASVQHNVLQNRIGDFNKLVQERMAQLVPVVYTT